MRKRTFSMLLALCLLCGLCVQAFAAAEPAVEPADAPAESEEVTVGTGDDPDEGDPEEGDPDQTVTDPAAGPEIQPGTTPSPSATSGSCGANVNWSISGSQLTISGSGAMTDYLGKSEHAPWYGRHITSAVIGSGVTSVGNEAFYECAELQSVTIPASVIRIGDEAFEGCVSLTSATLPAGLTSIGSRAFYDCNKLTAVSMPDTVQKLGADAFSFCTSLTSARLSGGLRVLDLRVFNHCSSLTAVTIPSSVTVIGDSAFDGCASLASVSLSEGLTEIGSSAFQGCALTRVTIPRSVTAIGDWAFADCGKLASVTIRSAATELGIHAFSNTPWSLRNGAFFVENGVLYEYQGNGGAVTVPSTARQIAGYAFNDKTEVTAVTIPSTVRTIGQWAFGNTSITTLTVPASVTEVGSQAFAMNLLLRTADVSAGKLGAEAFWYCPALTDVILQQGVTSVGDRAFDDCGALKTLTVLNKDCSLGAMTLPSGVVIRGYAGSTAETFARKNGYTFQVYSGQTPPPAQLDGWVPTEDGDSFYYYHNGQMVKNMWVESGRALWYYIGSDGVMRHSGLTFVPSVRGINKEGGDAGQFAAGYFYLRHDNYHGCLGQARHGWAVIEESTVARATIGGWAYLETKHNGHYGACTYAAGIGNFVNYAMPQ